MNKLIEDIWEETTKTCIPREGDYSCVSKENIQKFAELIIQECLDQIDKAIPCTNCSSSESYKTAKIAAISRIQQHFEIKE